jgi:hypothetical protein
VAEAEEEYSYAEEELVAIVGDNCCLRCFGVMGRLTYVRPVSGPVTDEEV